MKIKNLFVILILAPLLLFSNAFASAHYFTSPAFNTTYHHQDNGSVGMCHLTFSVQIVSTLTLSGGQSGTAILEVSQTGDTWTEVARVSSGLSGTLVLGLSITKTDILILSGDSTYDDQYYRIRNSGTSTITLLSGTEAHP